jgi:hypothetical protein
MLPHQRRLHRVALALPVDETPPHLLAVAPAPAVVLVVALLRKVPALRVDKHERLRRVVGPPHGIRQVGQQPRLDGVGGDELALVERVRREAHDGLVHAVLRGEHALDGGAVEGEEAVEEGGFEGDGGRGGRLLGGRGLGAQGLDGGRELEVVAGADGLAGREQGHPALRLEGLAGLVDEDDVEALVAELEAAGAVERREDHLAAGDEVGDAAPLALAVLLAEVLEVGVDGAALAPVARLADRGLLGVHLGADVLDDGAGFRGAGEHVEGVVEDGGEEAGRVAEADERDFVGGEPLDDVIDGDVGGSADEDALVALDELEYELDEGVRLAGLRWGLATVNKPLPDK